jgi:hypothetical protein
MWGIAGCMQDKRRSGDGELPLVVDDRDGLSASFWDDETVFV